MTEVMLFKVDDLVRKTGGDYSYQGIVVAAFRKLDPNQVRYVVENETGLLFIFSGKQLELIRRPPPTIGHSQPPFIPGVVDVELP